MTEFITPKGKRVVIGQASFQNAIGLKNAVQKALLVSKIDIASIELGNLEGIDLKDVSFDQVKGLINTLSQVGFSIDSDPEVNKYFLACLERSTFDGERINAEAFERIEIRESYYEIMFACFKEVLSPFFAPLFSKLKTYEKTIRTSQNTSTEQMTAI